MALKSFTPLIPARQGSAPAQYGAPAGASYGAPSSADSLGQYGDNFGAGSSRDEVSSSNELDELTSSIPGVPGQDYPIRAEVPEVSFSCDGRVAGGEEVVKLLKKPIFGKDYLALCFVPFPFLGLLLFSIPFDFMYRKPFSESGDRTTGSHDDHLRWLL